MSTIIAAPAETVQLALVLTDGATGLYPQARIYSEAGVLVAGPLDLSHVSEGLYRTTWVVAAAQKYVVVYTVYSDALHTIDLSATREKGEDLIVADAPAGDASIVADAVWDEARSGHGASGSFGEALRVLLGSQAKANFRIDTMSYNVDGFLTTARVRVFPSMATASASTPGGVGEGEIHTITITGAPDGTFPVLPATVLGLLP